jgi:8-oxo-dGTP pyrophosphatase MutT (NUDIX family)
MEREKLLTLLQEYIPEDHEDFSIEKEIAAFVRTHKNCFDRSLAVGHITASAWLLDHTETKALLMLHTKLGLWVQCGGHCDGNSDTLSVAIKEAKEESGLMHIVPMSAKIFDLDIHKIPKSTKEEEHLHYDIRFLLKAPFDEPLIKNSESKALLWIDQEELLLPTQEKSILRMMRKWKARKTVTNSRGK